MAAAAAAAAAEVAAAKAAEAAAAAKAAEAAARPPMLARTTSMTLKEAVARRAKRFKAAYFGANGSGPEALDTDSLRALRQLCGQLIQDPSGLKQLFEVRCWPLKVVIMTISAPPSHEQSASLKLSFMSS